MGCDDLFSVFWFSVFWFSVFWFARGRDEGVTGL